MLKPRPLTGGLKPPIAGSASRRSCLLSRYRADRSGSAVREQPVQSANEQLNERWSRVLPSKGQLGDMPEHLVSKSVPSSLQPASCHRDCYRAGGKDRSTQDCRIRRAGGTVKTLGP